MKRSVLVVIGCIFVATLTAMHDFAQMESGRKGKILYQNNCQFCHGIWGDGKGPDFRGRSI